MLGNTRAVRGAKNRIRHRCNGGDGTAAERVGFEGVNCIVIC